MKWVKRILLAVFAISILAAIVWGFLPKPVEADTVAVARGPLQITVDAEGRTRVKDRFTVFAPVAASMQRITLKAGDAIVAGDTITRMTALPPAPLDARTRAQAAAGVEAARAGVDQAAANVLVAQAELEYSVKEVERLRRLLAGKNTSQDSVDAAVARHDAARAALASAQFGEAAAKFRLEAAEAAMIEEATPGRLDELKSPVSGRVLRVLRESEGPASPGEPLVEIGDPQSLEIVADLLSRDAVRVKAGMDSTLERWGGEGSLPAVVRLVEPFGFTKISALGVEEQRVNVILDFSGGTGGLGDGYRVEVRVILEESLNVLKVPAGAVFTTTEGPAAFAVEGGRAARRTLSTGRRNGLEVEILDGLSEGALVILHPPESVKNGVAIQPR